MAKYDVAILGSGPGGYVGAIRAARRGAKVCLIEAKELGGTCLNVGCIPTKAMLHSSELFHSLRGAKTFGIETGGEPSVDFSVLMARTRKVVGTLVKGVGMLLKARGVDVVQGFGMLTGPKAISVKTADGLQEVRADNIIIATGSEPFELPFAPFDHERIISTDDATKADVLPKSILIVGGGVIGVEFATVYSELGVEVTVLEMMPRIVPPLDDDAAKEIFKSLKKRRVKIKTGAKITSLKADGNGVVAEIEGAEPARAEVALVAVGRRAVTGGVGLEAAGVETDGRIIKVDDHCRTNVAGIYAIGDAACAIQYAHVASRMGIVAADNATGNEARDALDVVPAGVYTHPEVGTVGVTEEQAAASGRNIKVARFPYQASGMAQAYGETAGLVKIIADADTGEILGTVIIGPHATDVIHEVALAMRAELTVEEIAETIHAHPTFSEAIGETTEVWLDLAVHIP
ncbi:MAG: dihydrolipoyl dehydrogenase [Planctomycetia bacterium]|nr:dihydrolipoyl dehydrogenase [Planctomycetia bacterium]